MDVHKKFLFWRISVKTQTYLPLSTTWLSTGATYQQPTYLEPRDVSLEDPAIMVMTDLRQVRAEVVAPDACVDEANYNMMRCGVRMMLVIDAEGCLLGMVTADDVMGDKPLRHIQANGGCYKDVMVEHVMTPVSRLGAVRLAYVLRAKVGNILATLKKANRQHALVVDIRNQGKQQVICGIFSLTQLARQLGIEPESQEVAATLAEIEALVVNGH